MKIISLLGISFATLARVKADNNDPVIFVHGYSSSSEHYQYGPELEAAGLKSIAADVNPIASNHERACELWAQLTGTLTDYGVCHTRTNDHERFGPDYTGRALLEKFDADHKIHLIGHSQGGLTIRYFERMLEQGYPCDDEVSEFLKGKGRKWITSITTLATPNNGATAFDGDFGRNFGMDLIKLNSFDSSVRFDLSAFNLVRKKSQGVSEFLDEVEESGILSSDDFGIHDMSTAAVEKFNTDGPTSFPDRFYFAIATELTNPEERCVWWGWWVCDTIEVPDAKMSDYYREMSSIIGSTALPIDRENDGIVSNNQARCPKKEEECYQLPDGNVDSWTNSGIWYMIDLDFVDHMQLVLRNDENDATNFAKSAKRVWLELGVRIKNLPSSSLVTLDEDEILARRDQMEKVKLHLEMMKQLNKQKVFSPSVNKPAVVGVYALIVAALVGSSILGYKKYKALRNKAEKIQNGDEKVVETGPKMTHYTV